MKLTIIVPDKTVYVDNVSYSNLNLTNIPLNVRVLQWKDIAGHIEFTDGTYNQEITELPVWAKEAQKTWELAKKEESKLVNNQTVETFWDDYPVANDQSITTLLLKTYEGISNVRGVDPTTNIVKSIEVIQVAYGPTALASLSTLLNDAKTLGVPVTSSRMDPTTSQNLITYLVSLGYSVFNGISDTGLPYTKVYYPWSAEMAAAKSDQDINIGRETTIAAGVDWNGSNWQIDLNSRNNIMNQLTAITSGIYTGSSVTWRNTANQDITLTIAEFKQLAAAVVAKVEEIYLTSFAAKG